MVKVRRMFVPTMHDLQPQGLVPRKLFFKHLPTFLCLGNVILSNVNGFSNWENVYNVATLKVSYFLCYGSYLNSPVSKHVCVLFRAVDRADDQHGHWFYYL